MATDHNFYQGFEGEPELIVELRVARARKATVRAWTGYFDELMALVPPSAEGWTGLALHYHLCTGWQEENEWIDPDPADTRSKLDAARDLLSSETARSFADALLSLYGGVVREGGVVVWRLE
ncbi:MAG: hypothetical protein V4850_04645 [Myxococcota bacterium]